MNDKQTERPAVASPVHDAHQLLAFAPALRHDGENLARAGAEDSIQAYPSSPLLLSCCRWSTFIATGPGTGGLVVTERLFTYYNSQWSLTPKTDTGPRSRLNAGSLMNW
jgi:hypothetical protein